MYLKKTSEILSLKNLSNWFNTTSGSPKKKLLVLRRLFLFFFKENIWKIRQKCSRQLPVLRRPFPVFFKENIWKIRQKCSRQLPVYQGFFIGVYLKFCHWKICQIDPYQHPVPGRLNFRFASTSDSLDFINLICTKQVKIYPRITKSVFKKMFDYRNT